MEHVLAVVRMEEYESGKRCLLCHEECDGCNGGSQQDCIACKNVKNFLGDGGRFECLASGSCPTNTFENVINSTCDECHPNCAECIGTSFENCTRCKNPPGYTIIPPEDDDPGVFGCCDDESVAVEENQTCVSIEAVPQTGYVRCQHSYIDYDHLCVSLSVSVYPCQGY